MGLSLTEAFVDHAFPRFSLEESGRKWNRTQKWVGIENRTQDLRVFSSASYKLSQKVGD